VQMYLNLTFFEPLLNLLLRTVCGGNHMLGLIKGIYHYQPI